MKSHHVLLPILLTFLLLPTGQSQSGFVGRAHSFTLAPDYSISSFTQAPLTWAEDSNVTVAVNVTLTDLPDQISSVQVDYVEIITYLLDNEEDSGIPERSFPIVPKEKFTEIDQETMFLIGVEAPILKDLFYLNITLYVRTLGNITQTQVERYSYRFPEDNTILVSRENDLVPLINLYGFPPRSFFENWLPIYLVVIVIILIPGYLAGISRISERMSKKEEIQ
ncbi:MAG: hypothetical protein INQ03_08645 [Candidatus Heimdallarchaeota archaeon]|nr:hypothetical protein [Candidatus Heimdallarchaeota archaeon]